MEKWKVYDNNIFFDGYFEVSISFLFFWLTVYLFDDEKKIEINFYLVHGFRLLDEGIVQNGIYLNDDQLMTLKKNHFCNVLYELTDGEFGEFIFDTAGGFLSEKEIFHYVVITPNYNIDIVSRGIPKVTFL